MGKSTKPAKTLAEQIAELDDPAPKDLDPEDQNDHGQSSDEGSNSPGAEDDDKAREHYEAVGKSKLRKPEKLTLGKQYDGSRVSRDALNADDSSDDPFGKGASENEGSDGADFDDPDSVMEVDGAVEEDEEIDSDEAFGEGDVEKLENYEFLGSKSMGIVNGTDSSRQAPSGGSHDDEDGDAGIGSEDSVDTEEVRTNYQYVVSDQGSDALGTEDYQDDSEDQDAGADSSSSDEESTPSASESQTNPVPIPSDDRAAVRKLMALDQKSVAATISQAAKADAAKGQAVKQQRSTFDALLNTRIKLQKGLLATNALAKTLDNDTAEAIRAAESTALTLWSNLEALRQSLADPQTSSTNPAKRKLSSVAASITPTIDLWTRMQSLESTSMLHRRSILDKWSAKVRGSSATLPNARGKLFNGTAHQQQTITSILDTHLATESDRLPKRARTFQTNRNSDLSPPTPPTYDDTLFYQSLLRDLVSQRMSSSTSLDPSSSQPGDSLLLLPARLHTTKSASRKSVDTKASKGRKMRYTIHEKLQNFMAPEERGTWGVRAREELFGSLLGQRGMLRDDDGDEGGSEDDGDGGLRLFRS